MHKTRSSLHFLSSVVFLFFVFFSFYFSLCTIGVNNTFSSGLPSMHSKNSLLPLNLIIQFSNRNKQILVKEKSTSN